MLQEVAPRPAVIDDLEQIAKIESYSNHPPWAREAFAAEFGKSGSCFWVLSDDETDEKIFAYAVFSFLGEQAHIQTFAVERSARRKGYASRLLRFMINYVLRKGGDSVYLEVRKGNLSALALYQKLGFMVVRTVKGLYPDGEDAYAMLFKIHPKEESVEVEALPEELEDDNVIRGKKDFN